eukprot:3083276-Pyramimonas_sp.AAC.1
MIMLKSINNRDILNKVCRVLLLRAQTVCKACSSVLRPSWDVLGPWSLLDASRNKFAALVACLDRFGNDVESVWRLEGRQ